MDPKETALIGLVAAVFTMVCCQIFVLAAGAHPHFSSAQPFTGLAICLAGVVVGVLLVLCASVFQEARSVWDRSLSALGLALGCVLLLALIGHHTSHAYPAAQEPTFAHRVLAARDAPPSAPGTRR